MTTRVTVKVTDFRQSRGVDLRVNGRATRLPIGVPTRMFADDLDALRDSGAAFEVVPDVPAAVSHLEILQAHAYAVDDMLAGLTVAQLRELLVAEALGKNRISVHRAIEAAIADLEPDPA